MINLFGIIMKKFKLKKADEPIVRGIKCEKCGNDKYIVKDCGFTAICTKCKTIYKD